MAEAIRGNEKDKRGPTLLGRGGPSDKHDHEYDPNPSRHDGSVTHAWKTNLLRPRLALSKHPDTISSKG